MYETSVKKRRKRTIIMPEQLEKLEYSFKQEQWPNRARKERLGRDIGMSEHFVSIWFQNKRARVKREEEIKRRRSFLHRPHQLRLKSTLPSLSSPSVSCCYTTVSPQVAHMKHDKLIRSPQREIKRQHVDGGPRHASSVEQVAQPANHFNEHVSEDEIRVIPPKKKRMQTICKTLEMQAQATSSQSKCDASSQDEQSSVPDSEASADRGLLADDNDCIVTTQQITLPAKDSTKQITTMAQCCREPQGGVADGDSSDTPEKLLRLTRNINSQMNWGTFGMNVNKNKVHHSSKTPTEGQNTKSPIRIIPNRKELHVSNFIPSNSPTLFHTIINMIALSEGTIIPPTHPEFPAATNDALYGILINNDSRLIYDPVLGLDIVDIV